MRAEKKPSKREQALHDATHGQFGEEPRSEPIPYEKEEEESNDINDNVKERIRTAHRNQEALEILAPYIFLSCFIGSKFSMYLSFFISSAFANWRAHIGKICNLPFYVYVNKQMWIVLISAVTFFL
jgi:hypothetical protein